ncbi:MAG: hypothetical protein Q7S40_17470 [Opitutaceae bacterium]|nr:hypothetical protein [Opitutaceae bacterium]
MLPSVSRFEFQLQFADYAIIAVVMLLLVAIGVACRRMISSTRDFFVGGNRMSWWLAGTSVFMAGFSAWTFTGAAGLAYTNGHVAILYFFMAQGIGFLFAAFFVAHRCRQTRKVTTMEVVCGRFGRITEQVVVVLQVLSAVPMGAIWLTGLALFFSVAFAVPMAPCIIVAGTVILIYSTLGGSWAVATSDFFQGVLLLLMVLLVAGLTYGAIGGVEGMVQHVPARVLRGFDAEHSFVWLLAAGGISFLNFSSLAVGTRYLSVIDGRAARKVALLACALFLIGPVAWFFPPIAASYLFPDLQSSLPLLKHPQEGAYVIMGLSLLPPGLAGLLLMNIFGATLTTLDAAVNQTSGFLTMNVYRVWIRKGAADRELVLVARVFSVLFGVIVMALALALARSEKSSLLDLNLNVQSIVAVPMLVPFFLLWFVRRAPQWSALVTILIGVMVSYALNKNVYWPELPFNVEPTLAAFFGLGSWPVGQPFPFAVRVFGTVIVCGLVFLLTRFFWSHGSESGRQAVMAFYATMDRPVDTAREVAGREDSRQFIISGILLKITGVVLILLGAPGTLKQGSAWITVGFGLVVTAVGFLMHFYGRANTRRLAAEAEHGTGTPLS